MKKTLVVVVILVNLFTITHVQALCTGAVFNDVNVNTVGEFFCDFIERFQGLGITGGCMGDDPGTLQNEAQYCPDLNVTRSQIAVFVTRAIEKVTVKPILFTQQDHVTAFNLTTGAGRHVGTVTGKISGTSIVDFQYTPTSPLTFNFDNKVMITDLDGDQLRIRNQGTGEFITPIDPSMFALGGPLVGTYEVLNGTGKYNSWVGMIFPCRAVLSNPTGGLGTVYIEVLSNPN
jgi:hypothetical protein